MPNILIEAAGLTKEFQLDGRRIEVLRGVDLVLEAGETVAIVGPSGAGKSTLLHILGLLDTPTGGHLSFAGRNPAELSHRDRARIRLEKIGFVFQFHHLLPEFTAVENVTMPALIRGEPCRDCRERAVELLNRVGLAHRLEHKPGELSGGEQQRVAFARALINNPALILADEPTGNLDRAASAMLRDLLYEVCTGRGTTLVIVTHNETLVSGMARVLRMMDGRF